MTENAVATRPAPVRWATVLAWIVGELTILGGVLVLTLLASGNDDLFQGVLFVVAFITIVLGLLTVFLAGGLLRGSRRARVATTILMVLSAGVALFAVLVEEQDLSTITLLMSLAVIVLLWVGGSRRFFRA